MMVGDNTREGSVCPPNLESVKSNHSEDALSPEDIAWADSCLIGDPDYLDSNWDLLRDALLEVLDDPPESVASSVGGHSSSVVGSDMEIVPSNDKVKAEDFLEKCDFDLLTDGDVNEDEQGFEGNLPKTFLRDAILPNYKNALQGVSEASDSGYSPALSADDTEPLTEDIFRVWNLEIPAAEDEFVKQLNKALGEALIQSMHSDDLAASKDESSYVDDLIAGLEDLSLDRSSV